MYPLTLHIVGVIDDAGLGDMMILLITVVVSADFAVDIYVIIAYYYNIIRFAFIPVGFLILLLMMTCY